MIISERGLMKAMKAAFRADGYSFALDNGCKNLMISTADWMVSVKAEWAPTKVLGLIVDHTGIFPQEATAYRACRIGAQKELYELFIGNVTDFTRTMETMPIVRTGICFAGYPLWQTAEGTMVKVVPEHEDILEGVHRGILTDGNILMAADALAGVYIQCPMSPGSAQELTLLDHLSLKKWFAE